MTDMINKPKGAAGLGDDYDKRYGFRDDESSYDFKSKKGLDHEIVEMISRYKKEPEWMRETRHAALDVFRGKPMPTWGNTALLSEIDFENIHYYVRASERQSTNWEDVPPQVKATFDKLGIPEAERKFLAGVTAQYESEVVYHSIREDLNKLGVLFTDMDTGLREHEDVVRKYFGTVIPSADNKFAALNTAVWSGGSFVYVPKGVKVEIPLQAYFRINTENMGQFERTLIIADEGSSVHYIEGCTAPTYSSDSLHSAVVELIAMEGSKIRYTTIQNWSKNVYNLVTKRAVAHKGARVEWIDGNLGSKLTMKYPAVYLVGEGAHAEVLSVAFSGAGQHQDAGSKVIHAAPNTTSVVTSKSVSKDGGRGSYRGLVKVHDGATGSKVNVKCDALILDDKSRSDTYPTMEVDENRVAIEHEATVSKVGEEQVFYLQSRGLTEQEATLLIVNGFIEPFTKELPMEYAVELNRLIQLEMEGAVG
jgi:Fe-S cluster assembly protein SufB